MGQSSTFDPARITAALDRMLDTVDLGPDEEALWLDSFTERMVEPSETERAFFADRNRLGLGVSLDSDGNLTCPRD